MEFNTKKRESKSAQLTYLMDRRFMFDVVGVINKTKLTKKKMVEDPPIKTQTKPTSDRIVGPIQTKKEL